MQKISQDVVVWLDPRKGNPLRLLLVFVPVAIWLHFSEGPALVQFAFALLGLVPLAAIMGEATEHLAERTGPAVGGLMNATFGNAVELIVALALLFKGEDTVVKASLTGSILGNLLRVLGASLMAGGWKFRVQSFNRTAAGASSTMMILAAIGMLLPAIFHSLPEVVNLEDRNQLNVELRLSLGVCVALMAAYLLSLLFSLGTHKTLFSPGDTLREETADSKAHAPGEDSSPIWSVRRSLTVLIAMTVVVSFLGEILADTVSESGRHLGLTELFLGVIVVAIVGNAAEHSSAVMMALKNKTDLAVGIALGSAMQVALFVTPVLVFASYLRAEPMDLIFTTLEIVSVLLAAFAARMVTEDGESNWLEGAMLLMVYGLLGLTFYFHPPTEPTKLSAQLSGKGSTQAQGTSQPAAQAH